MKQYEYISLIRAGRDFDAEVRFRQKKTRLFWLSIVSSLLMTQCTQQPTVKVIKLREDEVMVMEKDNIYSIALAHKVSPEALAACNNLTSYTLSDYQVLKIPREDISRPSASRKPEPVYEGPRPVSQTSDDGVQWQDAEEETNLENEDTDVEDKEPELSKVPTKKSSSMKSSKMQSPVSGSVMRRFGELDDDKKKSLGVFYQVSKGDPVRAVANGKVLFAGEEALSRAKKEAIVMIKHDDGKISVYTPVQSSGLKVNQRVEGGQIIGQSQEGRFYFELRDKNRSVLDPLQYCHTNQ